MGQCFSCKKSRDRFKAKSTKLCNQLQNTTTAVAPCQSNNTSCLVAPYLNNNVGGSAALSPLEQRRGSASGMAASFSNMNITNNIRGLVSRRRNRYKKDGFNLDLTYITENIIAMGYPASNIEGVYRNHIDDVVKFLDTKHFNHYYIYNLCSERSYDKTKFHNRVKVFPFDDHNPPKIESIQPFCNDVKEWLSKDEKNVAVVHCKAGKGRTGTMICCYLLHSGKCATADQALTHYGQTRTQDRKGVTIPSQVRYVKYYEQLLRNNFNYHPVSMYIKEFIFSPTPNFTTGQGYLSFTVSHQTLQNDGETLTQKCTKLRKNDVYEVKKGVSPFVIKLDYCLPLRGDIKVEFYNKNLMRKEKLFQFWFNTYFVNKKLDVNGYVGHTGDEGCYELCLEKNTLDIVNKKDKQNKVFSSDFKLVVLLQKIPRVDYCPSSTHPDTQDTPSESSAESSDEFTNDEDDWDSGEGNTMLPLCRTD